MTPQDNPTAEAADAANAADAATRRHIALWLVLCAAMVFAMVVLGGATRLTESGLSITDWRPLTGVLPPLTDADWQAAYDRYRASPEFQTRNFWMSVADFKTIFWLEYLHRLWGRLIGLVFLLPFLWFLARGQLGRRLGWRLGALFALGAAQGLMGWYMVKSGLVDRPDVSHYRLAAHLGLAFAIYGGMAWLAFGLVRPRPQKVAALHAHAWTLLCWGGATVLYGALVAGLDAGLAYNSFPLMDGRLLPPEAWALEPLWLNPLENPALVQFIHRVLGVGLALIAAALWWRARPAAIGRAARRAVAATALMALIQTALGIATLLSEVALPLGVAHQAGALVLFTLALWTVYELGATAERRENSSAPTR
ncbi:MAG: COX15/CtaA family protein [Alphaproteobacteria bacterium]